MSNKNKNIENEELKKLAPTLFSLQKVNNLKAPEGYFNSLVDSVLESVNEQTSSLSNLSKESNLKVPEGYFDSLSDRIMDKIEKEEKTKVIPFKKKKLIRYISVAASIAAIFALVFLLNTKTPVDTQLASSDIQFDELTIEEFEEALYSTETDNLICYIDFEDENDIDIEAFNEFNETNLDITSSEVDEYLSSDYYFDVEF